MPLVGKRKLNAWFSPKWFGWGWYPINAQGWVSTLSGVAIILALTDFYNQLPKTTNNTLLFSAAIAATVGFICVLADSRCEENPEWRWGNKPVGAAKKASRKR